MVQIGENEPTKIGILVKALNGDIETYTLEIYKENSNTNLKEVTVDGNKAEISKIAENTYEYTLDKKSRHNNNRSNSRRNKNKSRNKHK